MKAVMIVEDEFLVALQMADSVEAAGYRVVGPFTRLAEAEKAAREGGFDMALLDVNLGEGMTSAPVAELLRQQQIPFTFVTAYQEDQIDGWRQGDRILPKPILSSAIESAVAAMA